MNIKEYRQHANLIRDNELYKVYDFPKLKDLDLSLTELYPHKSTTGHSHDEADEVYVIISGQGTIEVGKKSSNIKTGDVIIVPRGDFHRVHNQGEENLSFWSIFEKYEGRGK